MTATAAWQETADADPSFCADRVAERESNRRRAAAIDENTPAGNLFFFLAAKPRAAGQP
jgi:hypothetical protein